MCDNKNCCKKYDGDIFPYSFSEVNVHAMKKIGEEIVIDQLRNLMNTLSLDKSNARKTLYEILDGIASTFLVRVYFSRNRYTDVFNFDVIMNCIFEI